MAFVPPDRAAIRLEVKGLKEVQRKMEQMVRDLQGSPTLEAMKRATMLVQRSAKKNAPVNTGKLRASITPEVRSEGENVLGIVGSNLAYAPFVELGTRPHWPPPDALARWVHLVIKPPAGEEMGIAYVIARKISRYGTRARRFLQDAFSENINRINAMFDKRLKQIVEKKQ